MSGMFLKNLSEIDNKRHQRMLEKMMYYNLDISYIKGVTNKIADCLSRLTRNIREAQHFPIAEPRLASMAKSAKQYVRQIQAGDPWVIQLAESAMRDTNYISMIHHLENGIMT